MIHISIMNIVLTLQQFNKNNVYFGDAIENTVMDDSKFIKVMYSNELVVLNGIFLEANIKTYQPEEYFKKIKYSFDLRANRDILDSIYKIEHDILNKYNTHKQKKYIIRDSLSTGSLKIFPSSFNEEFTKRGSNVIVKISGLWENKNECGVTYKLSLV